MKNGKEPVREFVISGIRKPFLRAGWSNLGIFFAVIGAWVSKNAAVDFGASNGVSLTVAAVVGTFFLASYTRSVSKIVIESCVIQLTCTTHRENIHVSSINRIKVVVFKPSSWVIIIMFLNKKKLPRIFDFTAFNPNNMEFDAAVTHLMEMFKDTGTNVS